MVKNQKHGWAVWATMFVLFLAGVLTCWWAESAGNPRMHELGIAASTGNMEGKETRFGIFSSALFATITTDASCGAVNSMHDSFTPLGGFVPMFNIHLGEVVFGGVGAGLYGMLVFVVIAIFVAGLMVGRTPEYLGKKIESYDVKVASLSILILTVIILGFTAWASVAAWGGNPGNSKEFASPLTNNGPHGFSEMHYAYTSGAGNNGSAFAGLNANEIHWNSTLAVDMLMGRFTMIVPILALAGSLAAKKRIPASAGSFPVSGPTFVCLLIGTVVIVGALTFVPALSLGPIVEHYLMHGKAAALLICSNDLPSEEKSLSPLEKESCNRLFEHSFWSRGSLGPATSRSGLGAIATATLLPGTASTTDGCRKSHWHRSPQCQTAGYEDP